MSLTYSALLQPDAESGVDEATQPTASTVPEGILADAEGFVRRSLALLEAEFRTVALLSLADWTTCRVVQTSLYSTIASLQRPSWGTWNGLIRGLRDARKEVLRGGRPEERQRVESAELLGGVVALLDRRVPRSLIEALQPLTELCRFSMAKRARVSHLLALPIALRNRVAHDAPTDPRWWIEASNALIPLVQWHADEQAKAETEGDDATLSLSPLGGVYLSEPAIREHAYASLRSPWFWFPGDGTTWSFNGVARDFAVVYAHPELGTEFVSAHTQELLMAFQHMLGRTQTLTRDLKQLLTKLVPEEIRGVVLGDVLVGRPVGEGGFAQVHLGRQLSTGRKVAVKILRDGMDEEVRSRFQQEAAFLSKYRHRHIVGVIGYGEDTWSRPRLVRLDDEPWFEAFKRGAPVKSYIVLDWIEGQSFEALFQAVRDGETELPSQRSIARWFAQIANALETVHASGLIHRDVKPSNIMIADDPDVVTGERIARLMDFGVARSQSEARTLVTTVGTLLGTDAYMAPEQLQASPSDELGPSIDIYAFCAAFYEVLTGQRLFSHDSENLDTVRNRKVRGELPARPTQVAAGTIPWELETIVLGGLQPEPADRYPSMAAIERDLRHYLADEPIEYRQPGLWRRAQLAYRRSRTAVHVAAAVFLAFAIGIALYVIDIQAAESLASAESDRAERLAQAALDARAEAEVSAADAREQAAAAADALDAANRQLAALYEEQGRQALVSDAVDTALVYLAESFRLGNDRVVLRHLIARAMAQSSSAAITLEGHDGPVRAVAWSGDGRRVATSSVDATIRVWDVATQRAVARIETAEPMTWVGLSEEGTLLAASDGSEVFIFDAVTGDALDELGSGWGIYPFHVVFSGDADARILVRDFANETYRSEHWARSGRTDVVDLGPLPSTSASISPDGTRMVRALDRGKQPVLWDLESERELAALELEDPDALGTHGFSDDGRWIWFWTTWVRKVRVFDAQTGAFEHEVPQVQSGVRPAIHGNRILSIDVREVAIESIDGSVQRVVLRNRVGDLTHVAFSADGRFVAGTTDAGNVLVWDAASGERVAAISDSGPFDGLALAPDGRRVVVASDDRVVRLWSTDQVQAGPVTLASEPGLVQLAVAPGGHTLLADEEGTLRHTVLGNDSTLPDLTTETWLEPEQQLDDVIWSADGAHAAVAIGGDVRILDRAGETTVRIGGDEDVGTPDLSPSRLRLAFAPDGTQLAVAQGGESFSIWTTDDGSIVAYRKAHSGHITDMVWSADGTYLLTAGRDARVRVWSPAGDELATWALPDGATPIELLLGADDAYTLSTDGLVRRWTVPNGDLYAPMAGHGEMAVHDIALSPDRERLATASDDRTVILWDTARGRPRVVLDHARVAATDALARDQVTRVAFSTGGEFLASATRGGDVFLWDADNGGLLDRHESAGTVRALRFSDDDAWLLAAGSHRSRAFPIPVTSATPDEVTEFVAEHVALTLRDGRLVPR